jgi:hypothetical protein
MLFAEMSEAAGMLAALIGVVFALIVTFGSKEGRKSVDDSVAAGQRFRNKLLGTSSTNNGTPRKATVMEYIAIGVAVVAATLYLVKWLP